MIRYGVLFFTQDARWGWMLRDAAQVKIKAEKERGAGWKV